MADETDRHGIEPDEELRGIDGMDEPSIDGLVKQLKTMADQAASGEGWAGIDSAGGSLNKHQRELQAAFRREARILRDTFATPDGRKALELLLDMTLRRPCLPEGTIGMMTDQLTPILLSREAENRFVRTIVEAIAQADNQPNPTRDF